MDHGPFFFFFPFKIETGLFLRGPNLCVPDLVYRPDLREVSSFGTGCFVRSFTSVVGEVRLVVSSFLYPLEGVTY